MLRGFLYWTATRPWLLLHNPPPPLPPPPPPPPLPLLSLLSNFLVSCAICFGRVHLLEVKLELIFVGDGDSEALDANLIVIEAFSEGCEVYFVVPLCVVCQA